MAIASFITFPSSTSMANILAPFTISPIDVAIAAAFWFAVGSVSPVAHGGWELRLPSMHVAWEGGGLHGR